MVAQGGFVTGLVIFMLGIMASVVQAAPSPVTDYGSYPAPLPDGCTADGSNILTGVQFANGVADRDGHA